MPSVSFHTLGCKLNFTETSTIGRTFQTRGYDIVPFGSCSDVVVINTCTVTEEANRKCRQTVRRAIRKNPNAYVIVTGCYAQLKPLELSAIDGVDLVLGSNDKFELFTLASTFEKSESTQVHVSCIDGTLEFKSSHSGDSRTRTFLKVQDGCDYSCSFCTIPKARGRSRSTTVSDILEQVHLLSASGTREVVLSGVNIGLFGQDKGESLLELVVALENFTEIPRFRISSIEPNLVTDELIEFIASAVRFVPHFHMPLQSGDDAILGLMRRRYRRDRYADRVARIKRLMPEACIGTDVIVGFPGETDEHFRNTVAFLEDLPVSYLHAFTYSERPGTLAAEELSTAGGIVPKEIRSHRNRVLRGLSEKKRAGFYREQIGTTRTVVWESTRDDTISGFTDNYVRVERSSHTAVPGQVESVVLESLTDRGTVEVRDALQLPVIAII
ncbi:MAG: tRNA (N(6)-L-threonylcarbamoyladenosine(37)-C(2))-methylthiotransferase MtaB [Rhodothermales bacterium]|nr:tRNA (N(6)-L-threonylcarbamoyladenosine(37)-C(2))-methylthiotransferase MtaB [Rhodothermales bacterium]